MTTARFIVLLIMAALIWWLTGLDKGWDGHSKRSHHFTRALRTLGVVFCVWLMQVGGPIMLLSAPLTIALLLRSSISEIFSGGFMRMIDPASYDKRELDLKRSQRHRDNLAWLIHHGKREQAIKLCEELRKSGELDEATLASTLEFLGVQQDWTKHTSPLNRAQQLRSAGKFPEAEQALKSMLQKNPADEGAVMVLIRLYAQDLRQPSRAQEVLRNFERQPAASRAHVEFARRSIEEWSRGKTPPVAPALAHPLPETVEAMIAVRAFGSAIAKLEEQVAAAPGKMSLRLKLAEVHAVHCANLPRAEKILRQAAAEIPGTKELVEARLKEWRESLSQRK